MKKLTILIDMDGIAADLMDKVLSLYNAEHGTSYGHEHVTDWSFGKCIPGGNKIFRYMDAPGFFRDLKPIPGTVRTLKELHAAGHDLHILSTPHLRGTCAQDKLAWVEEHLPFIGSRNTMLVRHKEMVKGDVLIDDKPETIEKYRRTWPKSFLATIAYPYNHVVREHLDVRAPSYATFEEAWDEIGNSVTRLARGEFP
jgi:5'-nucleotidase